MTTRALRDSRSVTLDVNGSGMVTFGPQRPGVTWEITRVSVQVSSNTSEPQANLYRGTINDGSLVSGTYSGSNDTDSAVNDGTLYPGQFYTLHWFGGDSGATATVSFYGTEYGD